jgi:hypothetical protein
MALPTDTDPRLHTIRSLLAKAEATQFPAEAEAFTAKAAELMARYAIDETLLWAHRGENRDTPGELRLKLHRPFTPQKAILITAIASVFGCRAIRLGRLTAEPVEHMSVIGLQSDLQLVDTLATSLMVQMAVAMAAATVPPGVAGGALADWRRSFIIGFVNVVAQRLKEVYATESQNHSRSQGSDTGSECDTPSTLRNTTLSESTALALRDKEEAVETEFRLRFPNVRSSSVSGGRSRHGQQAGGAAGGRADLGTRRFSARGRLTA